MHRGERVGKPERTEAETGDLEANPKTETQPEVAEEADPKTEPKLVSRTAAMRSRAANAAPPILLRSHWLTAAGAWRPPIGPLAAAPPGGEVKQTKRRSWKRLMSLKHLKNEEMTI